MKDGGDGGKRGLDIAEEVVQCYDRVLLNVEAVVEMCTS